MPIYMDVHNIPGVKAGDVADAHSKDLLHQGEFACKCMTYWIDEERETVFCLIDAPTKEAVEELHGKAHGLVPNKIIEVRPDVVSSFLGRIYDPEDVVISANGHKVFADSSFRILLMISMPDMALLKHTLGNEKTFKLLNQYNSSIRKHLSQYGGREADNDNAGFIACFTSASKAVTCALGIQEEISGYVSGPVDIRMAISAGEPVETSSKIFGNTLQMAEYMCAIAKGMQIVAASTIRTLIAKDHFQIKADHFLILSPQDELLLQSLFDVLEQNWQRAEFDVEVYSSEMAMSTSQLYRKTIQLTGLPPNILLKEFRLQKAKELMAKKNYNIAQVTFDAGFSSPSYFTKCFKTKYGLLPMAYLDLIR